MDRRSTETRNILAVANAFALVRGSATVRGLPSHDTSLRAFLESLDHNVAASLEVHLLIDNEPNTSTREAIETFVQRHPRFHQHLVPTGSSWLDEVEILLANNPLLSHENALGSATSPAALHDDIRAWCSAWTRHTDPFVWRRPTKDSLGPDDAQEGRPARDDHDSIGDASGTPPGTPSMAGPVVQLVYDALISGRFPPGERVEEAALAVRLGVSRGAVREALGMLVEDGMLERLPNHRAAVPDVNATTVLDLYAVRAALGTVIMRRAAMLRRSELRSVNTALAQVRAVARHGDHARIGEADLCFQDAIARIGGLPQASLSFQRLTMRIRMFIAVLQLDFADTAADLIARENAGIFEAIHSGDSDEAARLWRVKVERSVRYMVAKLPHDGFDSNLWATIAGKPSPRPGDPRKTPTSSRTSSSPRRGTDASAREQPTS